MFGMDIDLFPSYTTCVNNCDEIKQNNKKRIKELGKRCNCFSVSIDETSQKYVSTMCMIGRFIEGTKLIQILIKICSFELQKTGENITNWIINVLKEYELDPNKVLSITTDGAKNMTGAMKGVQGLFLKEIEKYNYKNGITKRPMFLFQIYCFDHRTNLVSKHSMKDSNYSKFVWFFSYLMKDKIHKLCLVEAAFLQIKNRPPMPGDTRWCSMLELVIYLEEHYDLVKNVAKKIDADSYKKYLKKKCNENGLELKEIESELFRSILIASKAIFNEIKRLIVKMETANCLITDCYITVLHHVELLFSLRSQIVNGQVQNSSPIKDYLKFISNINLKTKAESTNIMVNFLDVYLEQCMKRYLYITGKEPSNENLRCSSFKEFLQCVVNLNMDTDVFKYIYCKNILFFANVLGIQLNDHQKNKYYNYALTCNKSFMCSMPSNAPLESTFSVFRRHEHVNNSDGTNESKMILCQNINSNGMSWWDCSSQSIH